jgi:hypothetical protein
MAQPFRPEHAGHLHIAPAVAQEIALHAAADDRSKPEISLIALIAEGRTSKQIVWNPSIPKIPSKRILKASS